MNKQPRQRKPRQAKPAGSNESVNGLAMRQMCEICSTEQAPCYFTAKHVASRLHQSNVITVQSEKIRHLNEQNQSLVASLTSEISSFAEEIADLREQLELAHSIIEPAQEDEKDTKKVFEFHYQELDFDFQD